MSLFKQALKITPQQVNLKTGQCQLTRLKKKNKLRLTVPKLAKYKEKSLNFNCFKKNR